MFQLDEVEFGKSEELEEKIKTSKLELMQLNKPNSWNVYEPGNQEQKFEIELTKVALQVGQNFSKDIKNTTVKEYYILLDILDEKK